MSRVKKIFLGIALSILSIFLVIAASIVWLFSLIERATDPVAQFILNNDAYMLREVPESIVPLGISGDEFLNYRGVRKYTPIEDHNSVDGRQGFHRILRNRLGQCDMDLRLYATFNEQSELTSLNGFTPTYMCTIEP